MLVPRYIAAAIVGVRLRTIDADCRVYGRVDVPPFAIESGGDGVGRLHGWWVDPIGYANFRGLMRPGAAAILLRNCYWSTVHVGLSNWHLNTNQRHRALRTPTRRMVDLWAANERNGVLQRWIASEMLRETQPQTLQQAADIAAPRVAAAQVLVGADPEFELLVDGSFARADVYFTTSVSAQVGCDGAASTGELRPPPGHPDQVFANVQSLLRRVHTVLARRADGSHDIEVLAGAGRHVPLGGHIHISGAPNPSGNSNKLAALDRFVAQPIDALCEHACVANRRSRGYGRPREIRHQPHGWEYRTPASWLAHPVVAKGALLATYLIAKYDTVPTTLDQLLTLAENPSQLEALQAFYAFELPRGIYLDDVDAMEAWGLGKIVAALPSSPPEMGRQQIAYNREDYNLQDICEGVTTRLRLVVMGAREDRAERQEVVLLPSRLLVTYRQNYTPDLEPGRPVALASWVAGNAMVIYLSMALREQTDRARTALEAVVKTLERGA